MDERTFSLEVARRHRFQFDVVFDDDAWSPITLDEPEPLGDGAAPNAARFLAAAVGNCLSASLLYCLEKARVPVTDLRAHVSGTVARNDRGRLRIEGIRVKLVPTVEGTPVQRVGRCTELFEDFCVVTQSVRDGIDVQVEVDPDFVPPGDLDVEHELSGRELAATGQLEP